MANPLTDSEGRGADSGGWLLNLGCGRRVHPAWRNLDCVAHIPGVEVCDLRRGIPFPGEACAVVYHAHLLEHLTPEDAEDLLRECSRVLKPRGILRVVVPDLEGIARAYLNALGAVDAGQSGAAERHTWMQLELVDQLTRHQSGGAVLRTWQRLSPQGRAYARSRWGVELDGLSAPSARHSRERSSTFRSWGARALGCLRRLGLTQDEQLALRVGQFRLGGEVHRWMYDRVSLGLVFQRLGFVSIRRCQALESAIPNWGETGLDADASGQAHKPDSLYLEAIWPGKASA